MRTNFCQSTSLLMAIAMLATVSLTSLARAQDDDAPPPPPTPAMSHKKHTKTVTTIEQDDNEETPMPPPPPPKKQADNPPPPPPQAPADVPPPPPGSGPTQDYLMTSKFGSQETTGTAGCKTEALRKSVVADLKAECKAWMNEKKKELGGKYQTGVCQETCNDCGMSLQRCNVTGTIHYAK